jgi:hypothetical protein
MLRRQRRERGEGKIGCVLWSLVAIVVGVICWKAVPVKIASAELEDFMDDQAQVAANVKPEDIKKRILIQAKDLKLPLDEKNLMVERVGDNIRMRCSYTVPVEYPGYTYMWDFKYELNRPIFIF